MLDVALWLHAELWPDAAPWLGGGHSCPELLTTPRMSLTNLPGVDVFRTCFSSLFRALKIRQSGTVLSLQCPTSLPLAGPLALHPVVMKCRRTKLLILPCEKILCLTTW